MYFVYLALHTRQFIGVLGIIHRIYQYSNIGRIGVGVKDIEHIHIIAVMERREEKTYICWYGWETNE